VAKSIVKGKRKKEANLRWTEEQRAIATLYKQGKSFNEVVDAGHSKTLAGKVGSALKKGRKPDDWDDLPSMESLDIPAKGAAGESIEQAPREPSDPARKSASPKKAPTRPAPKGYTGPPDSAYETRYRIDTSQPVTVGQLQVLPEDWRISQYGVFLILDTFHRTKEEIGYDGSIGRFILDVFRFYRMFMQYAALPEVGPDVEDYTPKEVSDNGDGRGEEADSRLGVLEESYGDGIEEAEFSPGDDED